MRSVSKHRLLHVALLSLSVATTSFAAKSVVVAAAAAVTAPNVLPDAWLPDIHYDESQLQNVTGCCVMLDDDKENADQTCAASGKPLKPAVIGKMPQFTTDQALEVLDKATESWKGGNGVWTQMTLKQRCDAIRNFLDVLQSTKREEIVQALMWEIGKNRPDAESELDRTVQFAHQVIHELETGLEYSGQWQTIGTTNAFVRRAAMGVILALAPYNYPLNECYAAIIPALLVGNIVIIKIPTVGGLVHLLTMEALKQTLPPYTLHFIAGSGRKTMPPLMKTGKVDGLSFIGGSKAADELIASHPHPHRLKVFLQLEANNMAIYLEDLFQSTKTAAAALENAVSEAILGSLSYNGQRCTALKLHYAPKKHADKFVKLFVQRVESMKVGLPHEQHTTDSGKTIYSQITPLPHQGRVKYMQELIKDAVSKGAKIMNQNGGTLVGGDESTLMVPAVLYPVTSDMKIYAEEQFGPVIPIVAYSDIEEPLEFGTDGEYGQQVSIFTQGGDAASVATIIDRFHAVFGKVNLNSQCGRSPDTLPFSGRRSSALGVMSVSDALKEFSVPTVVAYKGSGGDDLAGRVEKLSKFMQPVQ